MIPRTKEEFDRQVAEEPKFSADWWGELGRLGWEEELVAAIRSLLATAPWAQRGRLMMMMPPGPEATPRLIEFARGRFPGGTFSVRGTRFQIRVAWQPPRAPAGDHLWRFKLEPAGEPLVVELDDPRLGGDPRSTEGG
jgi:hypothetical protein